VNTQRHSILTMCLCVFLSLLYLVPLVWFWAGVAAWLGEVRRPPATVTVEWSGAISRSSIGSARDDDLDDAEQDECDGLSPSGRDLHDLIDRVARESQAEGGWSFDLLPDDAGSVRSRDGLTQTVRVPADVTVTLHGVPTYDGIVHRRESFQERHRWTVRLVRSPLHPWWLVCGVEQDRPLLEKQK
jgi:hypothetical protein